ncbi:MAG: hypothetical protein BWY24_00691 [Microgenomates group bacterium ADurb.Bin219]|nr:MAG: hypothetical protein BWY24_00691 [Microgenomates group bacterium ADurb.Bin219]
MTPEYNKRLTETLIQGHVSVDNIREILRKEGLHLSDDSVRNIAYGIMVFREIGGELFQEPFFIYGSTAKGTAGVEPKIQEIQYWKDLHFLGSTFRIYGMSDLDIRCVAQDPQGVFEIIAKSKDNLSPFTLRPVGIRVDNIQDVEDDIKRTDAPSFYRRVLLLNSPIVLSGQDTLGTLTEVGRDYLSQVDETYEKEMAEARKIVRSRLEGSVATFLDSGELSGRFPVFYSERNLIIKNFQRTHSFKISFSLRESSLVVVEVNSEKDCSRHHLRVCDNPSTPFNEINNI